LALKQAVWLVIPLAAACATPSAPRWERSGATDAVVAEALEDCRDQAQRSPRPSLSPGSTSASTTDTASREPVFLEHELDRCMRAKGFRERR